MNRCLIVMVAAVLAAVYSADVLAQGDDIAGILNEITALSGELEKDIPQKIDENLRVKTEHENEGKALDQQGENLLMVKSALEADEAQVISVCDVTVPEEQYAAAVARCDAAKVPYQQRVDHYNGQVDELQAKVADLNEREQQRAREAQVILERRQQIIDRIRQLQAVAMAAERKACTASCPGKASPEAAAQCLQACFDGARGADQRPDVSGFVRPPFSGSTRTPEQAIEEYRRSGAANPGPNSLHTNPVPPPPSQ